VVPGGIRAGIEAGVRAGGSGVPGPRGVPGGNRPGGIMLGLNGGRGVPGGMIPGGINPGGI